MNQEELLEVVANSRLAAEAEAQRMFVALHQEMLALTERVIALETRAELCKARDVEDKDYGFQSVLERAEWLRRVNKQEVRR